MKRLYSDQYIKNPGRKARKGQTVLPLRGLFLAAERVAVFSISKPGKTKDNCHLLTWIYHLSTANPFSTPEGRTKFAANMKARWVARKAGKPAAKVGKPAKKAKRR